MLGILDFIVYSVCITKEETSYLIQVKKKKKKKTVAFFLSNMIYSLDSNKGVRRNK
jgi:hypothetical protein